MPVLVIVGLLALLGCEKEKKKPAEALEIKPDPIVYQWPKPVKDAPPLVEEDRMLARNYYLVLDGSGSMEQSECSDGKTKAKAAIAALKSFAKKVPQDANVGLLIFDQKGIKERLPLSEMDSKAFVDALQSLEVGGGTPLKSAIQKGLSALEHQARAQLGYGEYHLVVVTDGEANAGEEPDGMVVELATKTPVILQTIGFCIGDSHALNRKGVSLYQSANNPEQLVSGLETVLAESESFDLTDFK